MPAMPWRLARFARTAELWFAACAQLPAYGEADGPSELRASSKSSQWRLDRGAASAFLQSYRRLSDGLGERIGGEEFYRRLGRRRRFAEVSLAQ
jgi:hypothetical protein